MGRFPGSSGRVFFARCLEDGLCLSSALRIIGLHRSIQAQPNASSRKHIFCLQQCRANPQPTHSFCFQFNGSNPRILWSDFRPSWVQPSNLSRRKRRGWRDDAQTGGGVENGGGVEGSRKNMHSLDEHITWLHGVHHLFVAHFMIFPGANVHFHVSEWECN